MREMAIFLTDSYFSCDNSLVREKSLMNAVPIFEAKNRLPFFIHKAENREPVFISRHNKNVAVLISFEQYNEFISQKPKLTFLEKIAQRQKEMNPTLTDEEIDRIFNVRDNTIDTYETDVFAGVFDD